MYFVYILRSEEYDRFYTGQTNNYRRRLTEHNSGKVKATKPYLPYELECLIIKDTRAESLKLERKIKNLKSKKRLLSFIEKYNMLESGPDETA